MAPLLHTINSKLAKLNSELFNQIKENMHNAVNRDYLNHTGADTNKVLLVTDTDKDSRRFYTTFRKVFDDLGNNIEMNNFTKVGFPQDIKENTYYISFIEIHSGESEIRDVLSDLKSQYIILLSGDLTSDIIDVAVKNRFLIISTPLKKAPVTGLLKKLHDHKIKVSGKK